MDINSSNIAMWMTEGQRKNATHLIVVFDAINDQQFPVYVMPNENFDQKRKQYNEGAFVEVTYFNL